MNNRENMEKRHAQVLQFLEGKGECPIPEDKRGPPKEGSALAAFMDDVEVFRVTPAGSLRK